MCASLVQIPAKGPPGWSAELHDARFRALLSRSKWDGLPAEVQRRFSKRLAGAETALYRGVVVKMYMSVLGWLLTRLCHLFGAPLPLSLKAGGTAVVIVGEDGAGGQCWTRIYGRERGFPQVIHSAKRFAGPTGLEEYLGRGLGMALRLEALPDGLAFVTDHYFLQMGSSRLRLPRAISPGAARITHRQVAGRTFLFELVVEHPWAGVLINQQILFDDVD